MNFKTVDSKTLKKWLDNQEAVLVDVREPSEYSAKSIRGSVLVPLGTIAKDTLPMFKGKKLVINCQAGRRGGVACEKLLAEHPEMEVYNLEGGISAWENEGLAVEKS